MTYLTLKTVMDVECKPPPQLRFNESWHWLCIIRLSNYWLQAEELFRVSPAEQNKMLSDIRHSNHYKDVPKMEESPNILIWFNHIHVMKE